jgi:hypothetical protein
MEAVEVDGIRKEIGFGHRREMNEIRKIWMNVRKI